MIKPGRYLCKVQAPSNGWFGEAGDNNTPYIRLPLVVIDDGDAEGDQITYQGWLSDKSVERTVKNLAEVFGWDGDLVSLAKLVNTGPFVGKECSIVTEEEEYNGKTSVKIKWLNAPGGGGKSMDGSKALALAEKFAARAKSAAEKAKEGEQPKRKFVDPDLDAASDQDIPF